MTKHALKKGPATCPRCGRRLFESTLTATGWTHVKPMTTQERDTFNRTHRDPRPDIDCRWTDG